MADDIGKIMNKTFGIQALHGCQLNQALKDRKVGEKPPTLGRPSDLPDTVIDLLAKLFFTLSKIEQANASYCCSRVELSSLLGKIINNRTNDDSHDAEITELNAK